MPFCKNCGTEYTNGVNFCPNCGAQAEKEADFSAKFAETTDTTSDFAATDIRENKTKAILSYLGPLVFLPIFSAQGSRFARYHANQGLVLLIGEVAYSIVQSVLLSLLRSIFGWSGSALLVGGGVAYQLVNASLSLVWLGFVALSVIGIVNAANGRARELPLVGKIVILK